MLPDLSGPEVLVTGIKQYPDQPVSQETKTGTGLVSELRQKTALIATRPGAYTVPAIAIPWWNTVTDRMEVASLPAATLTISPPPSSAVAEPLPPVQTPPGSPAAAPQEAAGPVSPDPSPDWPENPWFWLAVALGAGWLLTALSWAALARRPTAQPLEVRSEAKLNERGLVAQLKRACRDNDPMAARRALEQWARLRWPELTPEALETVLAQATRNEYDALNRHLFSGRPEAWQGQRLWAAFDAASGGDEAVNHTGAAGLAALYMEPTGR
jgi:hypothetical protein